MPVREATPGAQQLDEAFAAAMEGPAKPREAPPPPAVDHEAPHGRDEHGKPLAPFGYTKDGAVRKTTAGRKPKDDQARVEPEPPPPGTALAPRDFSAQLMETGETLWFGGSVLAKVGPQVPIIGKVIPGRKLAATMAIFDTERPRLAAALNLAAQHDARARKLAIKLSENEAGWALTCMFMVAPFTGAVAAVWQTTDKHDALKERDLPGLDELAQRNEDALDRMFAKISAQMELAQAAQAAAMQAEMEAAMAAQATGEVTAGAGV